MKKLIVVLLILTLCFSVLILTGCKKNDEKVETWKVTFLDWDDSVIQVSEVGFGGKPIAPKNLKKPDDDSASFTFIGWDDLRTDEVETLSELPEINEDVSFKAVYKSTKVYYVHFIVDGEEYVKYNPKENYIVPEPEKEGYKFEGWYADEDFQTSVNAHFTYFRYISQDVYLYAKFSEDVE